MKSLRGWWRRTFYPPYIPIVDDAIGRRWAEVADSIDGLAPALLLGASKRGINRSARKLERAEREATS